VHQRVEGATRAELASRLQTLLNADIAALHVWFSEKKADAQMFASDVRIRGAILELDEMVASGQRSHELLVGSASAQTLQLYLKPLLGSQTYIDYVVLGRDRRILAASNPRQVGRFATRSYDMFFGKAMRGELAVSRPFSPEDTMGQAGEGPSMFVAAPVRSNKGSVVAVLGLRMKPEAQFTRIFSVARMVQTGEAYAFDHRGVMLTASRFEYELKRLGLIPKDPSATAILNLKLLDPGVDLRKEEPVRDPHREPPLTRMAAAALRGEDGVDVNGYRNYRGVEVVGAWAWLPAYGMGVATEVAASEAFQNLYEVRRAFLVLFLLVVLSGVTILGFTLALERLQASVRRNAVEARRLGQYVLMQEIGRGSNGMVYRARHALLRRPVAVKVLSPDLTDEANAARFEHEVQITSQLTHPNTVQVYDYGRTPEGLFYYAMEYLNGIDLHQLVRQFGPQPEGRVVHILLQAAGSLAEAHQVGLIHRDIKPANIFLTRRGGVCDVVKVLDFGLVKRGDPMAGDGRATEPMVGTPHFMSPEAVERPDTVDARSDLYSLGAVGYWLLTGKTLFDSQDVQELLKRQVDLAPPTPSTRTDNAIGGDLERLILSCLSKSPDARPPSADVFRLALAECRVSDVWGAAQFEAWWKANASRFEAAPVSGVAERTLVIADRG
jgi:tRNA A-37 threonylcarbamoyl transferase component Bud32